MTTYQEEKRGKSFDWWKALEQAGNWKENNSGWYKLRVLSEQWVTCACGNQCAIIPRDKGGEPEDLILSDLGYAFFYAMEERDLTQAAFLLCCIEDRAAELIKEIKIRNERAKALPVC